MKLALRKFVIALKGLAKPHEQMAEDVEFDHGDVLFWVSYREEPFLALAVPQGQWLSCKEVGEVASADSDESDKDDKS